MTDQSKKDREFIELLMKNQKRIYNFILLLVPNYSHADDLMQETVSVMWRKFDTYEPGTNFTAWAIKIARYKIANFRRKLQPTTVQFSEESVQSILRESHAVFRERQERVTALQQCLAKLSNGDRKLIALRYKRDIPCTKISEITGRSVNGLYHTFARIHRILLQCIQRAMDFEEIA